MGDQSKSARKTTRRRFHEPQNLGAVYKEFSPSESEWIVLEKAVGAKFSSDARAKIAIIVGRFMQDSADILSSPFADEVESELERIKSTAERLSKYLDKRQPEGAACSAMLVVRIGMLDNYSEDLDPFDEFNKQLMEIAGYCTEEIQRSRGYTERVNEFSFWEELIFHLLELFKSEHLPYRISGSPKPSPFVAFISELQRIRPDDFPKREERSDDALAKALRRAHRAVLDKRQAATRRERPKATDAEVSDGENVQTDHSGYNSDT